MTTCRCVYEYKLQWCYSYTEQCQKRCHKIMLDRCVVCAQNKLCSGVIDPGGLNLWIPQTLPKGPTRKPGTFLYTHMESRKVDQHSAAPLCTAYCIQQMNNKVLLWERKIFLFNLLSLDNEIQNVNKPSSRSMSATDKCAMTFASRKVCIHNYFIIAYFLIQLTV